MVETGVGAALRWLESEQGHAPVTRRSATLAMFGIAAGIVISRRGDLLAQAMCHADLPEDPRQVKFRSLSLHDQIVLLEQLERSVLEGTNLGRTMRSFRALPEASGMLPEIAFARAEKETVVDSKGEEVSGYRAGECETVHDAISVFVLPPEDRFKQLLLGYPITAMAQFHEELHRVQDEFSPGERLQEILKRHDIFEGKPPVGAVPVRLEFNSEGSTLDSLRPNSPAAAAVMEYLQEFKPGAMAQNAFKADGSLNRLWFAKELRQFWHSVLGELTGKRAAPGLALWETAARVPFHNINYRACNVNELGRRIERHLLLSPNSSHMTPAHIRAAFRSVVRLYGIVGSEPGYYRNPARAHFKVSKIVGAHTASWSNDTQSYVTLDKTIDELAAKRNLRSSDVDRLAMVWSSRHLNECAADQRRIMQLADRALVA